MFMILLTKFYFFSNFLNSIAFPFSFRTIWYTPSGSDRVGRLHSVLPSLTGYCISGMPPFAEDSETAVLLRAGTLNMTSVSFSSLVMPFIMATLSTCAVALFTALSAFDSTSTVYSLFTLLAGTVSEAPVPTRLPSLSYHL